MDEYEYVNPFLLEGSVFWVLRRRDSHAFYKFIAEKRIPECDMLYLRTRDD